MPTHGEHTLIVRGRKTHLFRGGAGRPLVFLHDAFCPSWLPLHDKLASEFEVFAPVHPGFVGSEDNFDQFAEMEDLVFHYLDLCEVLALDHPVVVGASFGGWIAAEWAIRHSDRLKCLILIAPLGLRLETAPAADVLSLDGAALRQTVFADPASTLAMETLPDTPKADGIVGTILSRRTLARFAWQFPDDPRLLRYLYRVRLPALILWGERDGYVPLAHGRAFHEGIANSELTVIPNVGHLPHVEAPEKCVEIMLTFLRRQAPSG
jgi:pimeloyl-ACP methyl ester carboxylesterase